MQLCTVCLFKVQTAVLKPHYRSQLHQYNLKRKSVGLPPFSEQQFRLKKQQRQKQKVQGVSQQNYCKPCHKKFSNQSTFAQHQASEKHKKMLSQVQTQLIESPKNDVEQKADENSCLFCRSRSQDMEMNLKHMSQSHSFFILSEPYCKDRKGLLLYLHQKVNTGMLCIYCDNEGSKDFTRALSVKQHMSDRGHTKMNMDNMSEYDKYYDYQPLHRERERRYFQLMQNKAIEEEEEWEDCSDQQGEQQTQSATQPVRERKFLKATLNHLDQLVLPDGRILGHRKYRHVYRKRYVFRETRIYHRTGLKLHGQQMNALARRDQLLRAAPKVVQNGLLGKYLLSRDLQLGMSHNKLQYYFRKQNP